MTKMRQWSIVTVVAVIIVLAAGWLLLVKPQNSKATSLRSQAATQQQQNAVLQSQIAQLQAEEKNLPRQQAALRKFSTEVPDNAAEPTVIRQLTAAANGAGVDLISLTPGTPAVVGAAATDTTSLTPATTSGGQLMELPVAIGISGTFPNVESFFQSLETLPRALMVASWSLCPEAPTAGVGSSGGGASCTAPSVSGQTVPDGTLGGTLSATIFYAPPAGAAVPTTTGTTATTPATTASPAATPGSTTAPSTATTPAPATSTAATPATTGATPPPAS